MFLGTISLKLEAGNRLRIPAKFRQELGSTFIVSMGFENCLLVYSVEEFSRMTKNMGKVESGSEEEVAALRMFYAGVDEATYDDQGRFPLTKMQRDHAAITKEAVIIGMRDYLEIWDLERWQKEKQGKKIGSIKPSLFPNKAIKEENK